LTFTRIKPNSHPEKIDPYIGWIVWKQIIFTPFFPRGGEGAKSTACMLMTFTLSDWSLVGNKTIHYGMHL